MVCLVSRLMAFGHLVVSFVLPVDKKIDNNCMALLKNLWKKRGSGSVTQGVSMVFDGKSGMVDAFAKGQWSFGDF